MNRLKQLNEILIEISKKYDMLSMRKDSLKDSEEIAKIEKEMSPLKDQVLYLLTAIKKLAEQENV